jgi:hypothetical protein
VAARLTRWEGLIDPFLVETVQTLASICPYRPPVGHNPTSEFKLWSTRKLKLVTNVHVFCSARALHETDPIPG